MNHVTAELEALAERFPMTTKSRKAILQPRHFQEEFQNNQNDHDYHNNNNNHGSLFLEFARVVCETRCIPRKELFEVWAMALTVHQYFWKHHPQNDENRNTDTDKKSRFVPPKRFVDLASGQGLLSWALLVLANTHDHRINHDSNNQNNNSNPSICAIDTDSQSYSAVCIDERMPQSAETLQEAMEAQWPQFCVPKKNSNSSCWDYVQARLECVEPDASTLLVGVHCCAKLSDRIIELAIQGKCPLALVPCCHSQKCLTKEQLAEYHQEISDSTTPFHSSSSQQQQTSLTDFIDAQRVQRLRQAGFHVAEHSIPPVFTPKNRILLATPPSSQTTENNSPSSAVLTLSPNKSSWQMEYNTIHIPVADTPEARAIVRSMAGRQAAQERQRLALILPLGYNGSKLPDQPLTTEQIESLVIQPLLMTKDDANDETANDKTDNETAFSSLLLPTPQVHALHAQPLWNPKHSQALQNFEIRYPVPHWSQRTAAQFHLRVCEALPTVFPQVHLRPLPKKIRKMAGLS